MTYQEPLSHMAIAIAISESADMGELGLAPEHLHDAMLALGLRLVYGGDLHTNGLTERLFELVARHRRDADFGDIRPARRQLLCLANLCCNTNLATRELCIQH